MIIHARACVVLLNFNKGLFSPCLTRSLVRCTCALLFHGLCMYFFSICKCFCCCCCCISSNSRPCVAYVYVKKKRQLKLSHVVRYTQGQVYLFVYLSLFLSLPHRIICIIYLFLISYIAPTWIHEFVVFFSSKYI